MASILENLYKNLFGGGESGAQAGPALPSSQPDFTAQQEPIRRINPVEEFLLGTKEGGQKIASSINRGLGLNTDDEGNFDILGTWGNAFNFNDENDNFDAGKLAKAPVNVLGAAGQTLLSIPGMMIQGGSEAPVYGYSALTGSPIAQEGAVDENGNIVADDLTAGERAGAGLYGALNVVPVGFGSAIGKTANKLGMRSLDDLATAAAKEAKGAKDVAKAAGLRASEQFLEEGIEEAVQEVGQNLLNDRNLTDNVFESFLGGGIAGGVMGGARGATAASVNAFDSRNSIESNRPQNVASFTPQRGFGSDPTYDRGRGIAAVEEESQKKRQSFQIEPGTTSGMGTSRNHSAGTENVVVGMPQLENIFESEIYGRVKNTKAINFFSGFDPLGTGEDVLTQWRTVKNDDAKIADFVSKMNSWIVQKANQNEFLDIFVMKNPGGTNGIARARLGIVAGDSRIGVSQVIAKICNGDFDSDKYVISVDDRDMYSGLLRVPAMAKAPDTYNDMGDFKSSTGIRDENIEDVVRYVGDMYDSLIGPGSDISKDELMDISRIALLDGKERDSAMDNVSDRVKNLINDGGMSSFNSALSWIASHTTADDNAYADALDGFYRSIGTLNENRQAVVAGSIANEIFSDEDATEEPGRGIPGSLGRINSMVEAKMAFFRKRLFVNVKDGEAACRENLSMYFMIKDAITTRYMSNPEEITDQELFTLLVKTSLGIEAAGVHPETLATGAVKEMAYRDATEEYRSRTGHSTINNKADLDVMLECLESSYANARNEYIDALKRYDQSGEEIANSSDWVLPKWDENNKMNVFFTVFGSKSVKEVYGVSPVDGYIDVSVEALAKMCALDSSMFDVQYGVDDANNVGFLRRHKDFLVDIIRSSNENSTKAVREAISKRMDGDIGTMLRSLESVGYDWNDPRFSEQDRQALMYYIDALAYMSGRKDFSKAGWGTMSEFMDSALTDVVARQLLSTDTSVVMRAMMTLSLRNKLAKFYSAALSYAENTDPGKNTMLANKMLDELSQVSAISPFYSAFANFVFNNIIYTDVDSKTLVSSEEAKRWFDDSQGFLSTMIDANGKSAEKRDADIMAIINCCPNMRALSSESVFASILESETDLLDMQSVSSRNRKAKPYLNSAAMLTNANLERRRVNTFRKLSESTALSDTTHGMTNLMNVLKHRALRRMTETSYEAIAYTFDTAGDILEAARDKTKALSASATMWLRGSISDIGYAPNEIQNLAMNHIGQATLEQNPQLASILLLTDYIKDQGGIWFTDKNHVSCFFENRFQLIGQIVGEPNLEEGGLKLEHLEALCKKCPNMINLISPVSNSYSDMSGTNIETSGISADDEITSILEEIEKGANIEDGENNGITAFVDKEAMAIRKNIIVGKILADADLLSTMCAAFNWDEYDSIPLAADRVGYVRKHIDSFANWVDAYIVATPETRLNMESDAFGLTMSDATSELIRSSQKFTKLHEANAGMPSTSILDYRQLTAEMTGSMLDMVYEKNYEDILSGYDLDGLGVSEISIDNVSRQITDAMTNIRYSMLSSTVTIYKKMLSLMYMHSKSSADVDSLTKQFENQSIDNARRNQITRIDNAIATIDGRITDIRQQSNIGPNGRNQDIDALLNIRGKLKLMRNDLAQAVKNPIDYISATNAYYDISVDLMLERLFGPKAMDSSNFYTSMMEVVDSGSGYIATGSNRKKKEFIKPLEEFNEFVTGKKSSFGDITDIDDPRIESWKIDMACRILSEMAQTSMAKNNVGPRFSSQHLGGAVSMMDSVRKLLSDSDFVSELSKYDRVRDRYTPSIKFNLTDDVDIARLGNVLANTMSGNVETGVTMNASQRTSTIVFGHQPTDPDFKLVPVASNVVKGVDVVKSFYDIYNDPDVDDREVELFCGRYSVDGGNTWKALRQYDIVNWRSTGAMDDVDMIVEMLADESCGFDNARMTPSADGRGYNQWLTILDKININAAESLNLKTKKNLKAFLRASFSNMPSKKLLMAKGDVSAMTWDAQVDADTVNSTISDMIVRTKKAYRQCMDDQLSKATGRDMLDLSYSDIKVIADHVVQAVVITFKDGHRESIMYRDILNGTSTAQIEALMNDHGNVTAARVHIFDISELGETLAAKTYDNFVANRLPRLGDLALDDDAEWVDCYADTLRTWKLDVASVDTQGDFAARLFSDIQVRDKVSRDSFVKPENSKLKFDGAQGKAPRDMTPWTDELKSAIDASGVDEEYGKNSRIARFYGDKLWSHQNMFDYCDTIDSSHMLSGWTVYINGNITEIELDEAIKFAKKTKCNISVEGDIAQRIESKLINSDFMPPSTRYMGNHTVKMFEHSQALSDYRRSMPRAERMPIRPKDLWIIVHSNHADYGDGDLRATDAGVQKGRDLKASKPSEALFDFADIMPGTPKKVSVISNVSSIDPDKISDSSIAMALEAAGMKQGNIRASIAEARNSIRAFVANPLQSKDGLANGAATMNGIACLGVTETIINSKTYYIPILAKNIPLGSTVYVSEDPFLAGSFNVSISTPIFGSRADAGVVKIFLPGDGLKVTSNLSGTEIATDHRIVNGEGKKQSAHLIGDAEFNAGKVDYDEQIRSNYTYWMQSAGLSLWFDKVEGGYKLSSLFSDWDPETIGKFMFGSPEEKREIAKDISSGTLKFSTSFLKGRIFSEDPLGDTLRNIATNAYNYHFDMFEALTGLKPAQQDSVNPLLSVIPEGNLVKSANAWTNSLIFRGIESEHIQELFHFASPMDYASTNPKMKTYRKGYEIIDSISSPGEDWTEIDPTFDRFGMMLVEYDSFGNTDREHVSITPVNFDDTQSPLQHATAETRIGNKQKQSTRFATGFGDYESPRIEMIQSLGLSLQANAWMKSRGDSSADRKAIKKQLNKDRFINTMMATINPSEEMRRRLRDKTTEEMKKSFDGARIKIKDKKNNFISTAEVNGSPTTFENDELQNVKVMLEQLVFDGNTITCNEFLTIMKLGLSYTEQASGNIAFYMPDLREVVYSIQRSIDSCGLPFDGGITVKTSKTFTRFGMPILPENIAKLFVEKNSKVNSKYKNNLDAMYEDMMKAFRSLMSSTALTNYAQKRSLFSLGEYLSRNTVIENSGEFNSFVGGLTLSELIDSINQIDDTLLGDEFKNFSALREVSEENVKKIAAQVERQVNRRLSTTDSAYDGTRAFTKNIGEPSAINIANNLVSLRQISAVIDPMLMPASIIERGVYGNPIKWLMHNGLRSDSGIVYKSNVRTLIGKESTEKLVGTITTMAKKHDGLRESFGALRSLSFLGDFDYMLSEAVRSGNIGQYLKSQLNNGVGVSGRLRKVANIAFDWASGKNIGATMQIDTFFCDVARLMSLDPRYQWYFDKDASGVCHFQQKLEADPEQFLAELFGPELRPIAMQAFNTAMQGDTAQKTALSVVIQEFCTEYPAMNLFVKTVISPFIQYGINVSGRHLNAILPVSTFNYLLTNMLGKSNLPIVGLHTYDKHAQKTRNVTWNELNLEDTQTCASLREALALDMLHMGVFATAALIVGLGCLEPPDDDDKWCNVNEWTFLGQRIELNWWLQDTVGPVLGIACAWKSSELGKPNIAVLMNQMADCMYANPIMRSSDFVSMMVNPYEAYMEKYYDDLDRFTHTKDGTPSAMEVLFADTSIAVANWASSFILPTVIKDYYRNYNEYEVSYKRIYKETPTGQLSEEGMNGETTYATYWDQKLRQATKKNPVLGFVADLVLRPNTGYLAHEMPRTVYYDPAQMESYQALSLYDYDENGNKVPKSDPECQAIALGIIVTLQNYSPEELRKIGFAVPYDTLDYVGDVVWDIAYGSTEIYQQYMSDGQLDYYKLGNGDYELGQQMASVLNDLYDQNYSYWSDFYYNKLWSDEMKSGLARYNRYNTTYQQDANGEWYATGFRNNVGNIVSPFKVAPGTLTDPGSTMGYDEDWDTRSVVTDESTGERALIPCQEERIKTPSFKSRGSNGDGTGYSRSYGRYSSYYSKGGGSSYTSPVRPTTTRTANTGGGYSTSLPRPANADTTTYRSPVTSYVRPSVTTVGSRQGYRRES